MDETTFMEMVGHVDFALCVERNPELMDGFYNDMRCRGVKMTNLSKWGCHIHVRGEKNIALVLEDLERYTTKFPQVESYLLVKRRVELLEEVKGVRK